MSKIIIRLLILVFVLFSAKESISGIIDWDRRQGLLKVEGFVVAVNKRENKITIKNRLSGKNVTYSVDPELLQGVAQDDYVLLKYKQSGGIVHSINVEPVKAQQ